MSSSALPKQIASVAVPSHLAVTAVASSAGCALQIVLRSNRLNSQFRLPTSPTAAFGTLVHEALELAARGDETATGYVQEHLPDALGPFRSLQDFAEIELDQFVDFGRRLRASKVVADAMATARPHRPGGGGPRRRGPEVFLSSDRLRLKGTADRISEGPDGVVEILDYKTGSVVDGEGGLKTDYVGQILSYVAMFLEVEPDRQVRGYLHNGERHEVVIEAADLAGFSAWLKETTVDVPPEGTADGPSLALPGGDCANCDYRPGCPAYLEIAPTWWSNPPEFRVPPDTWGVVRSADVQGTGLTIELLDDAQRQVRLLNLGLRHNFPEGLEGATIWAFGLRSLKNQRGRAGQWLHPRVFRDLPVDPGSAPAWACAIFVEASDEMIDVEHPSPMTSLPLPGPKLPGAA